MDDQHANSGSPPAQGARVPWEAVPGAIRAALEAALGSAVLSAVTQPGGFSPGVAARLALADGRRAFVKAVSGVPNAQAPRFHRREARVMGALPPEAPAPRLLWFHDQGGDGWVVLAFEEAGGRHPSLPWRADELARVLDAVAQLGAALTPSPVPAAVVGEVAALFSGHMNRWRRVRDERPPELALLDPWSARHLDALVELEARAPAAVAGDTLVHCDIRADNLLLDGERTWFVDWPHARVGAPWVDLVLFAPSVAMQGGPRPEELLGHPAARTASPHDIAAAVAAFAGFLTVGALEPPPPGLPTLRAFQEAQARVARAWLARTAGLT